MKTNTLVTYPVAAMTWDTDYTERDMDGLSQFEKNRFFKGKLMTPRDMEAEQIYHSERLNTINQFINGSGIVRGLEIQAIEENQDTLDITISPGLALDGNGRPIIVEQVTTKSVPLPTNDEAHVFIQYQEMAMETVPVPDTEGAVQDEASPNRIVEVFEVTCHEEPPDETDRIPNIDIPNPRTDALDQQMISRTLAEQYQSESSPSNPAVFLGSFERTPDGNWVSMDGAPPRSLVYSQQFLFEILVEHISDTDNPHRTPVTKEPMDVPEDVQEITDRIQALEQEVTELKTDRQSLTKYILRKTIKDRIRFFNELARRLEHQSGEASQLAREIADRSSEELRTTDADKNQFVEQLDDMFELFIDLGDLLEPVTTEKSLEHYLRSVSHLQSAIQEDVSLLELVDNHDQVCETVDSLDMLFDVVPDS